MANPAYIYHMRATGLVACFNRSGSIHNTVVFRTLEAAQKRINGFMDAVCNPDTHIDYLDKKTVVIEIIPMEIIEE